MTDRPLASSRHGSLLVLVLAAGLTSSAALGASFEVYSGTTGWGEGVSADGVVAGLTLPPPREAFRWSPAGFEGLGWLGPAPSGYLASRAFAVSESGVIAGETTSPAHGSEGFLWREGEGMTGLGVPSPGWWSYAEGISADGTAVAGTTGDAKGAIEGFRWTAQTGLQLIGRLPGSEGFIHPTAISGDGNVIVGQTEDANGQYRAFRWTTAGMVAISPDWGVAEDASFDGRIVVGSTGDGAFRWSEGGGLVSLGTLPGGTESQALGVSADGTIVVGSSGRGAAPGAGGEPQFAIIWDETNGMRALADVLESDYGVDLGDWVPVFAYDVSADGTVITGVATPEGEPNLRYPFRAVLEPLDTDGDGLLDSWETDGIDVDNDGTVDLDLPAWGANPNHKTLFIEVDAMNCADVVVEVIERVASAFASAEMVENPDGEPGIDLIVLVDEQDLPCNPLWQIFEDEYWPADFDVQKDFYFGTPEERVHPAHEALLAAKRQVFRYCIYASKLQDADGTTGTLGVARDFHANDFIIAKGEFFEEDLCPEQQNCDLVAYEAAVFMHEFGHCLGLYHGGDDGIEYKPNYISVMNYLESLPYEEGDDTWRLDYSQGNMGTLYENDLDEELGLVDITGRNLGIVTYFGRIGCENPQTCDVDEKVPVTLRSLAITNGQWVDFNGDGGFDQGVCADLNYYGPDSLIAPTPSPCDVMTDHNDWAALVLPLVDEEANPRGSGTGVPGELTVQMVRALHEELPAPCPADVDSNGTIDFDDLLTVLARWGETTGHPADVDANGTVDFNDLLIVLAAWGPCS